MVKQDGGLQICGLHSFLYNVVILQVADGNVETFLLSVWDCICRIAQCTALRNVEYIHDCSEGFV